MSALDSIKTIVIVMMENRSFDHLLGWMSLPEYGGRQDVDGLRGPVDPATRELQRVEYDNYALGHRYRPFLAHRDDTLVTDLPHGRSMIDVQLDFSDQIGDYTMTGFAKAYFQYAPNDRGARPESLLMFPPQLLPTTSFLARNFTVCDRWFSSVPADTQANRFMSLAGFTKLDDGTSHPPDHPTFLDWCDRRQVRWRVYHDGFSFMTVFRRSVLINPGFRWFDEMARDFQHEPDSTFPQVVVVEPEYNDDPFASHPNDNHPPSPMAPGEAFLARVFRAVTINPARWASTLMIVTHDEHGGFFDHVPPLTLPTRPPPGATYPAFATSGLRVPSLIVSPLVEAGSVFHGNLDHTSILRLLAEKFAPGEPGYSPEVIARHADPVARLASVSATLGRAAPRQAPALPPMPDFLAPARAQPRPPVTPNQQAFAEARAAAHADSPQVVADNHPEMLFHLPAKSATGG